MNNGALNQYLRLMRKAGYAYQRPVLKWGRRYLKYAVRAVKASRFVPKEKRQSLKNFI